MSQVLRNTILGVDSGAGALKVYGPWGGTELPAHVAFAGRRKRQARVSGLRTLTPPMQVITGHGGFYLGLGAHDWGRPVGNLADDRFLGAPETVALFYGGMSTYARQYGLALESVRALVGLTQFSFAEDPIGDVVSGVRVKLRLHPGEDDDLIDFFASLPERGRARAVIGALRSGDIRRVLVDEGIDDDQMADAFEGWLR